MRILNSTSQHVCWCGFLAALFAFPVLSGTVFAKSADNTHPLPPSTVQPPTATPSVTSVPLQPVFVQSAKPRLIRQVATRLSGIASWYGRALHGHKTASGERFDENDLTACHRTLPFGTHVRVTNMQNHLSVIVRITDRGVLKPERVIDLSSAAADKLGMLRSGVAPVRLNVVMP